MQRRKGATGERELVQELNRLGLMCRRSVQYAGKPGTDADVVCEALPMHIECKRTERFKWTQTLKQVKRDSKGKPWVIAYRFNDGPWLIIQPLEQWFADSTMAQQAKQYRMAIIAREAQRLQDETGEAV
jgi:Holliday junction resolvase